MSEEKRNSTARPLGMKGSSGRKERAVQGPGYKATNKGFKAFLEKRGLKDDTWKGKRFSEKGAK